MAVELASAYVSIVPSAQGMAKNLTRELGGPLDAAAGSAGKRAGGLFSGALGNVVKAAGGLFIAHEAFSFAKDAVAEARESNRVAAQTEQAIRSTGGAAKVTAAQISELANAISRKTGIDDEQIQSAANMLLTFTNIRNEAGKGNDIFNQSTAILADMSKVFGTDASGAAIQLGKALNDPIQGITALTRVGAKFTPQMKEQIKTLVEHGKVAEAQKIILKELNTEFGGQAAAQATAADRLKVTIGNIKEQIGGVLVPVIDQVAAFLADKLPGAIDAAAKAFGPLLRGAKQIIGVLFQGDFKGGGPFAEDSPLISGVFKLRDALKPIVGALRDFGERFQSILKPMGLAAVAMGALVTVGGLLAGVIAAVTSPITLVAVGIAGLVAGIVYAYTHFAAFRAVVQGVVDFFATIVIPAVQRVAGFIIEQFAKAVAWFRTIWPQISEAVGHVMNVIRDQITGVVAVVSVLWQAWGDDLLRIVKTVWNFIQETIENALQLVRGVIQTVLAVINGDWGRAWDGIKNVLGAIWDEIGNIISTAFGVVRGLFDGFVSSIQGVWSALWAGMKGVVEGIWSGIEAAVRSGVNMIIRAINDLIRAYNLLPFHKDVGPIGELGAGGTRHTRYDVPEYAEGGWVKGPYGSAQPAIVHAGEFVLSHDMLKNLAAAQPAWGVGGVQQLVWKDGRVLAEIASTEMHERARSFA